MQVLPCLQKNAKGKEALLMLKQQIFLMTEHTFIAVVIGGFAIARFSTRVISRSRDGIGIFAAFSEQHNGID